MKGFDDNMKLVKYKIKDIEGKAGVYKITCISNGRFYIGSSKDLLSRLKQHINQLAYKRHHNKKLQSDYNKYQWNKYGEDNFKFEVIEFCTKENHFDREQIYLDLYKNNELIYNKSFKSKGNSNCNKKGSNSYSLGRHHTDEAKMKISREKLGKNNPNAKTLYIYDEKYNLIEVFDTRSNAVLWLLINDYVTTKSKNPIVCIGNIISNRIKSGQDLNGLYFSYEPIEDKKVS